MIVEGGYNLPEKTAVKLADAEAEAKEPDEAEAKEHVESEAKEQAAVGRRRRRSHEPDRGAGRASPASTREAGINLVAWARPYFGLIVLTTTLLTAFGIVSMLRMPSGIYPEVAFPRIVVIAQTPGLAVKDVEVAVTRPIEEAVGIVLGVVRVRSKSVRGAAELIDRLRARDRHDPGAQRRPRPHGRGRRAAARRAPPRSPSGRPPRSSRSSRSSSPAAATRRRCTTTPTTTCGRGSAASPTSPTSRCRGATSARSSSRSTPRPWWRPTSRSPTWPTGSNKEHRLKAVGRLDRGTLQYQVLADTLATDPLDLEDRVIAEKNGQSIRLRDLGRVTIGHEDRTMAIRSNGKDAVALTVFRRLGGNALAVSQRPRGRAGRRRQERPARRRDPSRLRPGAAGPHGDRQRPRRHRHRRPDERRRSSCCSSRACGRP